MYNYQIYRDALNRAIDQTKHYMEEFEALVDLQLVTLTDLSLEDFDSERLEQIIYSLELQTNMLEIALKLLNAIEDNYNQKAPIYEVGEPDSELAEKYEKLKYQTKSLTELIDAYLEKLVPGLDCIPDIKDMDQMAETVQTNYSLLIGLTHYSSSYFSLLDRT